MIPAKIMIYFIFSQNVPYYILHIFYYSGEDSILPKCADRAVYSNDHPPIKGGDHISDLFTNRERGVTIYKVSGYL